MREVMLTRGKVALVDDEDFDLVRDYTWRAYKGNQSWYAATSIKKADGRFTTLSLHFLLMGRNNLEVDHKNGNGLDNRRNNLRFSTSLQNSRNKPKFNSERRQFTSLYKGVHFHKKSGKWRAMIKISGMQRHLGLFSDPTQAAHAYDQAAQHYFADFARTNFPLHEMAECTPGGGIR